LGKKNQRVWKNPGKKGKYLNPQNFFLGEFGKTRKKEGGLKKGPL